MHDWISDKMIGKRLAPVMMLTMASSSLLGALLTNSLALSPQVYANARNIRLALGHDAALPLYKQLVQENPMDITAASRLAACRATPSRHNAACPLDDKSKIKQLRRLLEESNYENRSVQSMFGISKDHKLAFAAGPVYLTPAAAGAMTNQVKVSPADANNASLQCLVSLFLLGLSVHCNVLNECLIGGHESVQLLQDLGLAFPCELDPELLVPYVHLFPMEACDHADGSLILATDLHPRVLSTTTVGTREDGAVMYIGPDSLALVRNLPLPDEEGPKRILDLCTGSGVQALAVIRRLLNDGKGTSKALCVDINERALRFVNFNAALNGLGNRVVTHQADLIAGTMGASDGNSDFNKRNLVEGLQSFCRGMIPNDDRKPENFDLILANPPFIPVPPDNNIILQRYGLFSAGGPDGEDVLKAVVQIASELLCRKGGILGVVSEFMNPPTLGGDKCLLERIQYWWSNGPGGRAILLTNEFPVDAKTYSERRADTRDELDMWLLHLSRLNVTHVSPGLLFISTDDSLHAMEPHHRLVPKTKSGSIWTPSNQDAVEFSQEVIQSLFRRNKS